MAPWDEWWESTHGTWDLAGYGFDLGGRATDPTTMGTPWLALDRLTDPFRSDRGLQLESNPCWFASGDLEPGDGGGNNCGRDQHRSSHRGHIG